LPNYVDINIIVKENALRRVSITLLHINT